MTIESDAAASAPGHTRDAVRRLVADISTLDGLEAEHLTDTLGWIDSGAPLYRAAGAPERHLVSYFAVTDEPTGRLLLVAHRKAGLWLPTGGHVEPGEHPWHTVRRECREELRLTARPTDRFGDRPAFLTVTGTRGPGAHVDVSLWFVLRAAPAEINWFDPGEFTGIRWWGQDEILAAPPGTLDPHLPRFVHKLAVLGSA